MHTSVRNRKHTYIHMLVYTCGYLDLSDSQRKQENPEEPNTDMRELLSDNNSSSGVRGAVRL